MPSTRLAIRPTSTTPSAFRVRLSGVRSRTMSTTSQTAISRHNRDRAIWSETIGVLRSGPELAVEAFLGLVDRALVGAGGEVLPAAVAHHERDLCRFSRFDRLRGLGERGMQDRAGRDAGEDAFGL